MKVLYACIMVLVLSAALAVHGQVTQAPTTDSQIQALQNALHEQQQQINRLHEELQQRDAAVQQVQLQLNDLQLQASHGQVGQAVLENAVAHMSSPADPVEPVVVPEGPKTIAFRGVQITPGGYLSANTIFRTHNANSDVSDSFGSLPWNGSANGELSEFRFSARHSRFSLLFEGKLRDMKATGYYEMDFLGASTNGNETQTNGFAPRVRMLFANLDRKDGWSFMGGQMWSLVTANKKGIAPFTEDLPSEIDASYNVGFTYARQLGFRVTKKVNEKFSFAFSVENPETVLNVQNPPANVMGFSTSTNATSPNNGFALSNTPGSTGVSTDLAPDLLAKVAFDPGYGHYEIKAVGRFFRDRMNGVTDTSKGGGLGFGVVLPVIPKKVDLSLQGLGGRGIGRFGTTSGPDVTLRPNGTVIPVLGYQASAGIVTHLNPKFDFYLYGGNEYYGRSAYLNSSNKWVGYGIPSDVLSGCSVEVMTGTQACNAQTRDTWEASPGFWYRIWKGKEGTVQYGMSYAYVHRKAWAGVGGNPTSIENIVMTSFRYYLP